MLKGLALIKVDIPKKRIYTTLDEGIIDYYTWFLNREYHIQIDRPLYGGHITVYNTNLYKFEIDWRKAFRGYNNMIIEYSYDAYIKRGGGTKGFDLFYMNIVSPEITRMKRELGIVDTENFKGLHITIGTSGKSGSLVRAWQQPMITIKH